MMRHSGESPRLTVDHLTLVRGTGDRKVFGAMLRSRRERRGLSLALIADRTKVNASIFRALEEGDLSKFPHGRLYRRCFVRQYVEVVGLPVDDTMAEFEHLFADELRVDESIEQPEPEAESLLVAENPVVRLLLAILAWLTRKLSTAMP